MGNSRSERRFQELWEVFLEEIQEQAHALQTSGNVAFVQERGATRRPGPNERFYDEESSYPRVANPRMRQMDTDPRMVQARDRRRLS